MLRWEPLTAASQMVAQRGRHIPRDSTDVALQVLVLQKFNKIGPTVLSHVQMSLLFISLILFVYAIEVAPTGTTSFSDVCHFVVYDGPVFGKNGTLIILAGK